MGGARTKLNKKMYTYDESFKLSSRSSNNVDNCRQQGLVLERVTTSGGGRKNFFLCQQTATSTSTTTHDDYDHHYRDFSAKTTLSTLTATTTTTTGDLFSSYHACFIPFLPP